jgi:O-antigen ligase
MTMTVVLTGPARVALAPMAWLLTGLDAAVRRPSLLVAGAVALVCLPSQVQQGTRVVTVADVAAGLLVVVVAGRIGAGGIGAGRIGAGGIGAGRIGAGGIGAGRIGAGGIGAGRIASGRGWLPFAAVILAVALATITASDVGESFRGFVRYAELFVLVPMATAMAIRDGLDLLLVAGSVVGMTVYQGAVGVWQYATKTGASYGGEYIRAVGTFGAEQVVALGAVLGYGIMVTLALGLTRRGRGRTLLLATAGLLAVPLALSLSRGAWIATAGSVLLMLVVFNWRIAALAAGFVVLGVLVLTLAGGAAGGPLEDRVTSIGSSGAAPDRSVQDRYALWTTAIGIWADHPVTGAGLKDFPKYRDSYAPLSLSAGSDVGDPTRSVRAPLLSPHNQYLMVLSEQGTVGILAFGSLLVTLAVGAVRRRRQEAAGSSAIKGSTVDLRLLDLVAPGIMAWTLVDFLYGDIGSGPTGVVLAILLGLVARRTVIVPQDTP